jgi:hypothetical protein
MYQEKSGNPASVAEKMEYRKFWKVGSFEAGFGSDLVHSTNSQTKELPLGRQEHEFETSLLLKASAWDYSEKSTICLKSLK